MRITKEAEQDLAKMFRLKCLSRGRNTERKICFSLPREAPILSASCGMCLASLQKNPRKDITEVVH